MSDKLPRSQFSTEALRALGGLGDDDVHDAWVDAMSVFFRPNRIEEASVREKLGISHEEGGLIDVFLLPGMLSAQVASSGYRFSRSETDIARLSNDSIGIMFWEQGHYFTRVGDEVDHFTTGDIHVVDMSRAIEGHASPFNTYSLILPREALMDLELDLDNLHLAHLSQKTPAVRLLRRHIHELQKEAPNMGPEEAQAMVGATVAMVKAVLSLKGHRSIEASELMQRNQLLEIRHFIDTHLNDPDLTPERIAHEVGVSRTQLYRLTEPLNGIKHFITRRRLRRAFQLLAAQGEEAKNIAGLAYDLGFKSEDAFRRAFTQTFSMTPKDVRNRGLQAYYDIVLTNGGEKQATMPTGDQLYKQWMADLFR